MAQERDSESGLPIKRRKKKNQPRNTRTGPKDPQSGLRGRGTSNSSVPEGSHNISASGRRSARSGTTARPGAFTISPEGRRRAQQQRSSRSSTSAPSGSSTRPSSSSSGGNRSNNATRPTPAPRKSQSGAGSANPTSAQKTTNYKAWAKANPKLAARLKKGQAGYEETRGSSSSTSSTSSRPQRGGDGAPGAQTTSKANVSSRFGSSIGNQTRGVSSRLKDALKSVKRKKDQGKRK